MNESVHNCGGVMPRQQNGVAPGQVEGMMPTWACVFKNGIQVANEDVGVRHSSTLGILASKSRFKQFARGAYCAETVIRVDIKRVSHRSRFASGWVSIVVDSACFFSLPCGTEMEVVMSCCEAAAGQCLLPNYLSLLIGAHIEDYHRGGATIHSSTEEAIHDVRKRVVRNLRAFSAFCY